MAISSKPVTLADLENTRERLLKEIHEHGKKRPDKALQKIVELRELDSATGDYNKLLHLLPDQLYQERSHFVLELLQNADDALYENGVAAELQFVIYDEWVELNYNEKGFTVEDVLAITGSGTSTKINSKQHMGGFIGEKGIGFKSVFAMAERVEITSSPWRFELHKDRCVVPRPLPMDKNCPSQGTRMRLFFADKDKVKLVAKILNKLMDVNDGVESLLFLQHISAILVDDRRNNSKSVKSVFVHPADRSGELLQVSTDKNSNQKLKYIVFEDKLEFPQALAIERWPQLKFSDTSVVRRMAAAVLVDNAGNELPDSGKLFCFLPTEVELPIPIYLQVDGQLTANRGALHDPVQNKWNKHLVKNLPDFIVKTLLSLRNNKEVHKKLPDYIPVDAGSGQLQGVFEQVIASLSKKPWVLTMGKTSNFWSVPGECIMADKFWQYWLRDQKFRESVEQLMGKRFVHESWSVNEKWSDVFEYYEIATIGLEDSVKILKLCTLPPQMLSNDENLVKLYSYLSACIQRTFRNKMLPELLSAPIFPLENGEVGPLKIPGVLTKYYYLIASSKRETGLEGVVECRIINPEYTYSPSPGGSASSQQREKVRAVNERNKIVRDFLDMIGVPQMTDENVLDQLQIPWLQTAPRPGDSEQRIKVLSAIFEAYRSKISTREDEAYLDKLKKIGDASFATESGSMRKLQDVILPEALTLYVEDRLFSQTAETLKVPKEWVSNKAAETADAKEAERAEKYRILVRQFLVDCGIRLLPQFDWEFKKFASFDHFRHDDRRRWEEVCRAEKNISECNPVKLTYRILDDPSQKILKDKGLDLILARSLYQSWKQEFQTDMRTMIVEYRRANGQSFEAKLRDPFWAAIAVDSIPIITTTGEVCRAADVRKVDAEGSKHYKVTSDMIPLVVADNAETRIGVYVSEYLKSLDIAEIGLKDLNALWAQYPTKPGLVIRAMIEYFSSADKAAAGLQIFDRECQKLRSYEDFCLGTKKVSNSPMIELQYGGDGGELGRLLHLQTDGTFEMMLEFFSRLAKAKNDTLAELNEELKTLLLGWKPLSWREKELLCEKFVAAFPPSSSRPVLIINSVDNMALLRSAGIKAFNVQVSAWERKLVEQAAAELEFSLLSSVGKLELTAGRSLHDAESKTIKELMELYCADSDADEREELNESLAQYGGLAGFVDRIYYAQSLHRTIGGQYIVESLPFLDKDVRFIISTGDKAEEVPARVITLLGLKSRKDAVNRFRYIQEERLRAPQPNGPFLVKPKKPEFNMHDTEQYTEPERVLEDIRRGMASDRGKAEAIENPVWRNVDPRQIDEMHTKILKTMRQIPSREAVTIERYVGERTPGGTHHGAKKTNLDFDVNEFLCEEYDGKCQLCQTQLVLSSGRKWMSAFHMVEYRDQAEWTIDRPFNVIGLCPNCHVLAKHGAKLDLLPIFFAAEKLAQGDIAPEENECYRADMYHVRVIVDGQEKEITLSPKHLTYFSALLAASEK